MTAQNVDLKEIAAAVSEALNFTQKQIEATQKAIDNFSLDEANLKTKIDKKKSELDRIEKRLNSLHGVRPPYMDEYEKVEAELKKVYQVYTDRFRHLAYLENQLEEYHREEYNHHEETEMNLKAMQNRLQEEELLLMRGETGYNKFEGELNFVY